MKQVGIVILNPRKHYYHVFLVNVGNRIIALDILVFKLPYIGNAYVNGCLSIRLLMHTTKKAEEIFELLGYILRVRLTALLSLIVGLKLLAVQ